MAGLAAASRLEELGIEHLVLERYGRAGGRFASRKGEGWLADHGARYVLRSERLIGDLIRKAGLEPQRVSIQGGVHKLMADGHIEVPPHGGVDLDRMCLDTGFSELPKRLAKRFNVWFNTPVTAIRWDNDVKVFPWQKEGQVFWFETEGGHPLCEPESDSLVLADGVILATTATAAAGICQKSGALAEVGDMVRQLRYMPAFTGMFKIPRIPAAYYALEGQEGTRLAWVGFEEKKAPERVEPRYSLIVADADPSWSEDLLKKPEPAALDDLYKALRDVVEGLPKYPISRTYKKWTAARPENAPLGIPRGESGPRWPVNPPTAPFALAGEYIHGDRAEDAVRSGRDAAELVLSMIPKRQNILGINLQS